MNRLISVMVPAILAAVSLTLAGCASPDLSKSNAVANYQDLFLMEDRFVPEVLQQDPNEGETFISAAGGQMGKVCMSLDEILPPEAGPAQKRRLMMTIMQKYGITACFVNFRGLPPCFDSPYCVSLDAVQILDRDNRCRKSKMFLYFKEMELKGEKINIKGEKKRKNGSAK